MIRTAMAALARRVGRSIASSPGQMKQELARQGRLGAYEMGAAIFGQSNAYRGDLGLYSVRQPDAREQATARAATASQRQPERGMERG